MNILLVLSLALISHFVADFLLQDREMAKNKSVKPGVLYEHLSIQVSSMFLFLAFPFMIKFGGPGLLMAAFFSVFNGIIHGLIDWNIWKLYKINAYNRIKKKGRELFDSCTGPLSLITKEEDPEGFLKACERVEETGFKYWEDHLFYVFIGLDQLLHGLTIVGLLYWIWR